MTDLDSPRKNNDCYFYYYSSCAKGDSCTFRHEPSALGCETMCSFWREGKCLNVHCNFRHMELRKNRKSIQCYWETQPGGCLKPHCPFLHQNKLEEKNDNLKQTENLENINKNMDVVESKLKNPAVDSLVVNFEEESDGESTTFSPVKDKPTTSDVKVKSLEQIKLEKIQAESAAYYSYPVEETISLTQEEDLRTRLLNKTQQRKNVQTSLLDTFETGLRKRKKNQTEPTFKKLKITRTNNDVGHIKIKTLSEIRAERMKKDLMQENKKTDFERSESEVSSTSMDEQLEQENRISNKIIILRKSPPVEESFKISVRKDLTKNNEPVSDINEDVSNIEIDTNDISKENSLDEVVKPEEIQTCIKEDKIEVSPDIEEVLLLGEDEDLSVDVLKEEDELLGQIDDFLS